MADPAAVLKDEGNEKFKAKKYPAAIDAYTRSLELNDEQHLCYSNRCAAYLKLAASDKDKSSASQSNEKALADAQKCVELMPDWGKGYRRVSDAFQALKRFDEAIAILDRGLKECKVEEPPHDWDKSKKEVEKWRFVATLDGVWHGTVHEVLGGYDQEMEFLDNESVRIEVLGRSIIGKYAVDIGHDPVHLNIQVPHQDIPVGMPPPPPVPYIARVSDDGLHLCCPYLKMERPTSFEGPGYVLMKNGSMSKFDNSEVASLSRKEKYQRCAQELLKVMPDKKIEEVSQTDSEDTAGEKLMQQVRFESSMFSICQMFGEDHVKEVLNATKGTITKELEDIEEIKQLTEKLRVCGLLEEDVVPGASQQAADKPSAVKGPATAPEPRGKDDSKAEASKESKVSEDKDSDDSCSIALVGAIGVAVAAVACILLARKN